METEDPAGAMERGKRCMTQERMEELTDLAVSLISEKLHDDEYAGDYGYSECVIEVPVYKTGNPDCWAYISASVMTSLCKETQKHSSEKG